MAEERREGFIKRIRPHAEWEGIRWGWDLLRALLIPSFYLIAQKLRGQQQVDWIGLSILLALCFLIGFLLFPSKRSRPKRTEAEDNLVIPHSKVEQILAPIFWDVKGAGAQAGILWLHAAWAKDVAERLEEAWDHWNYAGENLIHPLDARLDKLDFSKDNAFQLANERRDFMVEYAALLRRIKVDFPCFSSFVTISGYPSDQEYRRVLNGLRAHAARLDELADQIWKTETPDKTLHDNATPP